MARSEMTNQMSALFTTKAQRAKDFTNHCLNDSAVYMPFISRKGMSEWDDDSSKHFFGLFFTHLGAFFLSICRSPRLHHSFCTPPMSPLIRAASDIHRRCPLQNIAPLAPFLIIIFSQASSRHALFMMLLFVYFLFIYLFFAFPHATQ